MSIISKITCFSIFFFLIILITGCPAQVNLGNKNLSTGYDLSANSIARINVFYKTDSIVEIYYSINRSEFFKQFNERSEQASIKVKMYFYTGYDAVAPVDSLTDSVLVYSTGKNAITGSLSYRIKRDKIMIGEAKFRSSNVLNTAFFIVEKPGSRSRQNFLVMDSSGNELLFRNNLEINEQVKIQHRQNNSRLFLKVYKSEFPLALPPFSFAEQEQFKLKPDSISIITFDGKGFSFKPASTGLFHLQTDTFSKEGLTLFVYGKDFPGISTLSGMIPPLRYITSKQEYEELTKAENKKTALDEFWLEAGGNPTKAKDLIKTYYKRVEVCNQLFSSYLEGWKTDRGMIYLIFGQPDLVTRSAYYESWTYGESNNISSLVFNFSRIANPFTDNDFELNRSVNYKNMWFEAVGQWRKGRPFNFNDN